VDSTPDLPPGTHAFDASERVCAQAAGGGFVIAAPVRTRPRSNAARQAQPAGGAEVQAARAGGFHESSYELQAGLQVSESEWPDDVTVPGKLGER
jgi:hypothetical protein